MATRRLDRRSERRRVDEREIEAFKTHLSTLNEEELNGLFDITLNEWKEYKDKVKEEAEFEYGFDRSETAIGEVNLDRGTVKVYERGWDPWDQPYGRAPEWRPRDWMCSELYIPDETLERLRAIDVALGHIS